MQVKKQQLEPDMEQQTGSKLGKALHLCLQEYNQSDFGIDHLVMSMCRVFLVLLEEGVLL